MGFRIYLTLRQHCVNFFTRACVSAILTKMECRQAPDTPIPHTKISRRIRFLHFRALEKYRKVLKLSIKFRSSMFAFKIIIVRLNCGRRSRILSLIFHIRSPKYYGKVFCENAHNQIVFRKGSKCVLYDHVGLQKAKFLMTCRPNLL